LANDYSTPAELQSPYSLLPPVSSVAIMMAPFQGPQYSVNCAAKTTTQPLNHSTTQPLNH